MFVGLSLFVYLCYMQEYAHVEHFEKEPFRCESVTCMHVAPSHDQHLQYSFDVH